MEQRWHYVYYSYEEWGRGYIGKRSSKVPPEKDPYMGSFKDKTFKPTQKIIIDIFDTTEEALQCEILLHKFYDIDRNPHFANQAKQTSTGFSWSGGAPGPRTAEWRESLKSTSKAAWQDPIKRQNMIEGLKRRSKSTKWKNNHRAVRQSPEYRQKISEKARERWGNPDFREKQEALIRNQTLTREWKDRHAEGCKKNRKYLYTLISPLGEEYKVTDLRAFCIENDLNPENIRQVSIGAKKTHKKWRAVRCCI
jgi:hypothetical protein